jgi:hypothetical protein
VPKGPNGLTGIDILDAKSYDDFAQPGLIHDHGYGYAQVENDDHAMTLMEALDAGVADFDTKLQACRDDFQLMVDTAIMEV